MLEFEREWTRFNGETPPLAFVMRDIPGRPWVRFHALHDGIRYAETLAQRDEIRTRARALGSEILGVGSDCWLVQCWIEEHSKPHWKSRGINSNPQLRYRLSGDDFHWVGSASKVVWRAAAFDELLANIAEDAIGPTLWCGRETGSVFAPYDGGFDLFPTSMMKVAELKDRHPNWLSRETSGL